MNVPNWKRCAKKKLIENGHNNILIMVVLKQRHKGRTAMQYHRDIIFYRQGTVWNKKYMYPPICVMCCISVFRDTMILNMYSKSSRFTVPK